MAGGIASARLRAYAVRTSHIFCSCRWAINPSRPACQPVLGSCLDKADSRANVATAAYSILPPLAIRVSVLLSPGALADMNSWDSWTVDPSIPSPAGALTLGRQIRRMFVQRCRPWFGSSNFTVHTAYMYCTCSAQQKLQTLDSVVTRLTDPTPRHWLGFATHEVVPCIVVGPSPDKLQQRLFRFPRGIRRSGSSSAPCLPRGLQAMRCQGSRVLQYSNTRHVPSLDLVWLA